MIKSERGEGEKKAERRGDERGLEEDTRKWGRKKGVSREDKGARREHCQKGERKES